MNENDLAFIRKAMDKQWLFWCYFWRWPNLLSKLYAAISESPAVQVKDIYPSLKDVELERDAAVAALRRMETEYDAMLKAQKRLLKWIHTTHRLSNVPVDGIRALFAAGKRLKVVLLFFFVAASVEAQVPPILRNHWTTNAAPIAITTLLTNGVRVATNIWELDLTNSATVTITAISNANKAIISFTGATSGGGDTIWTNDAGIIYPITTTNTVAVPGSLWAATNLLTSLLIGDVQAGISEYGLPYEPFKFGIFRTPRPTSADIDVIWTAFSPNNFARHEFYSIARTNSGDTYTFHEASAQRDDVSSVMTMRAKATTNNLDAGAYISATTSDLTATPRSFFDLRTFGSANANSDGNGEAMFRLKTTLPNITNALFLDFQTNTVSVLKVDEYGNIYNKRLTPSTVLVANSLTNITSLANAAGSLTNDGSGNLGWGSAGSSGISSAYSNNVLAGSSLTQLGFTNTSTVTVAISSNANRATVSLTAIGDGVGIATNNGTGFSTTFYGQTNVGSIDFTNTGRFIQRGSGVIQLTNATFQVPAGSRAAPGLAFGAAPGVGFTHIGGNYFEAITGSSVPVASFSDGGGFQHFQVGSAGDFGITASDPSAGADIRMYRAGVGTNGFAGGSSGANPTGSILASNVTLKGSISVGTGVVDGGGLKHGRVTTGSIGIGSTALVTLTWASAFADANYTVSAQVEDSTTTSLSLSVVHVESKTTTNVAVRIINNSATTAITGTLNVLAIHD